MVTREMRREIIDVFERERDCRREGGREGEREREEDIVIGKIRDMVILFVGDRE